MSLSVIFGLISFLPVSDQGKYHLTGSEGPIEAQVGSNVVLPCSVKPPVTVRDGVVEWMFNFGKTVHLFRSGGDHQESQDESYKDRTSLNHKMLEHGDVSLTLTKVTKNDAGIYTCIVLRLPGQDKSEERNIILVVVDGNENDNPDNRSGDKNGAKVNLTDPGGTDPGVNGCGVGCVVGVVVSLIILIFIIYCVVRLHRGEQIFQRWSNNSRHEQRRNDGGMETEQFQSNNFY